jgi:D-glycero-alpha-D-manno-heptose-7-phosphate kinase
MIVRSKAPLRISFGGGGTDVSPYPDERGGATVSTTIDKYAYCTLIERDDEQINVKSLDYGMAISYRTPKELRYDGKLDLIKAAIKSMNINKGVDLLLHNDVPPGTGLGASSAIVVALIGSFKEWQKNPLTDYEIAEAAYHIEREELGIKGGRQDQYGATFGGFNFIEYFGKRVVVNPLRIKKDILNELEYRLVLCYTGTTRLSARIIDDQISGYVQKKNEVVHALDETKRLATAMKNTLLLGEIDEFGDLLNESWHQKKKFTPKISNPKIDEMYEEARKTGAIGGKLSGAGGGGYLLLLCEFDKRHAVVAALEKMGGNILPFAFEDRGLQTWKVNSR